MIDRIAERLCHFEKAYPQQVNISIRVTVLAILGSQFYKSCFDCSLERRGLLFVVQIVSTVIGGLLFLHQCFHNCSGGSSRTPTGSSLDPAGSSRTPTGSSSDTDEESEDTDTDVDPAQVGQEVINVALNEYRTGGASV